MVYLNYLLKQNIKYLIEIYLYVYKKKVDIYINLILKDKYIKNNIGLFFKGKNNFNLIKNIKIENNDIYINLNNNNKINNFNNKFLRFIFFLKNNYKLKYNLLSYMTCIDNLSNINNNFFNKERFNLNYFFESFYNLSKLNINFSFNELNLGIVSLIKYYNNSNWFEREIWDMFGIYFFNHPDLRKILTDYGFEGYPLRKDFPLTGYLELRYDDKKRSIVYENLEISQEYRFFNFSNSWTKIYNKHKEIKKLIKKSSK